MANVQMLTQWAVVVQYMHLGYEKTSSDPLEFIFEKTFFGLFWFKLKTNNCCLHVVLATKTTILLLNFQGAAFGL